MIYLNACLSTPSNHLSNQASIHYSNKLHSMHSDNTAQMNCINVIVTRVLSVQSHGCLWTRNNLWCKALLGRPFVIFHASISMHILVVMPIILVAFMFKFQFCLGIVNIWHWSDVGPMLAPARYPNAFCTIRHAFGVVTWKKYGKWLVISIIHIFSDSSKCARNSH